MKQLNEVSIRKMRWLLFLLSRFGIRMIGFVRPKLILLDDENVKVKIRLNYRTRNHLKSMYFGVLAVGADVAGGIHAFYFAKKMGLKVSFAFKSMNAEFLKRAESDTIFECAEGKLIEKAILESQRTGERINRDVHVSARNTDGEEVASFILVVSVKVK